MKKVILLILVIQHCFFYGQEERPKPPKFSASDRVGILYFEAEEVAENIKVKEDSDQFYEVAKALRTYNGKVKEVAFLNSNKFKELDLKINEIFQRDVTTQVDPEVQEREKKELEELRDVIPKARKKVITYGLELNKSLKTILKEKQYKKWVKYQKKQYKTLLPEKPKTNNDNERLSRSGFGTGPNVNRGGLGRSRY